MNQKLTTMLCHKIERPYLPEAKDAIYYYTNALEAPLADCGGPKVKPYRTALYINEDGIQEELSVSEAVQGGYFDENVAEGITIVSTSEDFSALLLQGKEYRIKDASIIFYSDSRGEHVNDFNGYGSLIGVFSGGRLLLEKVYMESHGVAKPSVYCYEKSDVLMKDCVSRVQGGTLYEGYINCANPEKMVAPPWVLGITGNARGTNLTGYHSSMTVVNSLMSASQWGVMSTDMGSEMQLVVIDSELRLLGTPSAMNSSNDPYSTRYGSGYGTYAIGNAVEEFYGVRFRVGTYATILTGGNCTYRSSKGKITVYSPQRGDVIYEGPGAGRITDIDSDAFGFMAHGKGSLTLTEGTHVYSKCATFLLKEGGVTIRVADGTVLEPENHVLLQIIDNDDTLVGAKFENGSVAFCTEFHETEGWPSETGNVTSQMELPPSEEMPNMMPSEVGEPSENMMGGDPGKQLEKDQNVRFIADHVTLCGDFFNGSGYYGQPAKKLMIELGDQVFLDGSISATETIHVNENGTQNVTAQ